MEEHEVLVNARRLAASVTASLTTLQNDSSTLRRERSIAAIANDMHALNRHIEQLRLLHFERAGLDDELLGTR